MLMRVRKRCETDRIVLVDWSILDELWFRDDIKPPDREALFDKYLWLWISSDAEGMWFEVPEIGWNPSSRSISFSNGRNRTAVVTKHQALMPVAVEDEFFDVHVCRSAVIRELAEGDLVELPDLSILTGENQTNGVRSRIVASLACRPKGADLFKNKAVGVEEKKRGQIYLSGR